MRSFRSRLVGLEGIGGRRSGGYRFWDMCGISIYDGMGSWGLQLGHLMPTLALILNLIMPSSLDSFMPFFTTAGYIYLYPHGSQSFREFGVLCSKPSTELDLIQVVVYILKFRS